MTNDEIFNEVVVANYGYDDVEAITLGMNDPDSLIEENLSERTFQASDIRTLVGAALDLLREEMREGN